MASSANSLTFDEKVIYINKEEDRSRTELWGIPDVTITVSETAPSNITLCVRSDRKELIQRSVEHNGLT